MRWLIIAVFLFLSIWKLSGQVEISASFDQDSIVIGNEVSFTLSLEVDSDVEVLGVATYFLDSIYSALQTSMARVDTTAPVVPMVADFEMISDAGWKDLNDDGVFAGDELSWNITSNGNKRLLEQTFTIKLWDPGDNIALYPTVLYLQDGEQLPTNIQEQFSVFVTPPVGLPLTQDSMKVAPIKTIKEEATDLSDYLIYFIIIGLAIVLGLIYWLYTRFFVRDNIGVVDQEEVQIKIPSHIVALRKLSELKSKKLWQNGDIKSYQTELTYIIREYLEGRYGIAALESTTDEIVKNLNAEFDHGDDSVSLKRILQVADLVKFAKAKPDENVHEVFMNEAENFVEKTKPKEAIEGVEEGQVENVQNAISGDDSYIRKEQSHESMAATKSDGSEQGVLMFAEKERLAPYWRRWVACNLDIIFAMIFGAVLYTPIRIFTEPTDELNIPLLVLIFCLMLSYYVWLEYKYNRTLGKRLLKIRVVGDGGKPSLIQIVIRNIFKLFIALAGLPVITLFFTKKRKAMYDLLARTYVVREENEISTSEAIDDYIE